MPNSDQRGDITMLLKRVESGDVQATGELIEIVYVSMQRIARQMMAREHAGHTLQATALVHEVFIRLFNDNDHNWNDRCHFFRVVVTAMSRYLVDHARTRKAIKRGGGKAPSPLDHLEIPVTTVFQMEEIPALVAAIDEMQAMRPEWADIVHFRLFANMEPEQIAELLDCSIDSVKGKYKRALKWLRWRLDERNDRSSACN